MLIGGAESAVNTDSPIMSLQQALFSYVDLITAEFIYIFNSDQRYQTARLMAIIASPPKTIAVAMPNIHTLGILYNEILIRIGLYSKRKPRLPVWHLSPVNPYRQRHLSAAIHLPPFKHPGPQRATNQMQSWDAAAVLERIIWVELGPASLGGGDLRRWSLGIARLVGRPISRLQRLPTTKWFTTNIMNGVHRTNWGGGG